MIVADTSALISLAVADSLALTLDEFDVHTTSIVIDELQETAEIDDVHGRNASSVLDRRERLIIHEAEGVSVQSARIDRGEASCLAVEQEIEAVFVLTDDLRAVPELQVLCDAEVAISALVLRALVQRGKLDRTQALNRLEKLAADRDWLGAPIYRRAIALFGDED